MVDIKHAQGVITVEADTLGRFTADEVPFGQISLRCRLGSDQSPVVTGWITLLGRVGAAPINLHAVSTCSPSGVHSPELTCHTMLGQGRWMQA